MKTALILLFGCMSFGLVLSQNPIEDGTHRNFEVVTERSAEYPGGDMALYTELFQQMRYPEAAKEAKVSGNVMVSFYVEPDSTTREISALNDLGLGTKEEAIRLVKGLKFAPAIQNGKPIRQQMMIQVIFKLYD